MPLKPFRPRFESLESRDVPSAGLDPADFPTSPATPPHESAQVDLAPLPGDGPTPFGQNDDPTPPAPPAPGWRFAATATDRPRPRYGAPRSLRGCFGRVRPGLAPTRIQGSEATCGLHSTTSVIDDVVPDRGPLKLGNVQDEIVFNDGKGLNECQLVKFLDTTCPTVQR